MSKAVVILSLTTAVLGASTAYLAVDKYSRNTVAPADPPLPAVAQNGETSKHGTKSPQSASSTDDQRIAAPTDGASQQPPDAVEVPAAPAKQSAQAEGGLLFARQFLARYDDSAQRDALLEETRIGVRRQYARLKEQLKLSDSTFEQLVTLLAEETLQIQERFSRCAVDAKCDASKPVQGPPLDDHSQEFLALLGTPGAEAFSLFRGSIGERDQVVQLRARLPDSSFLPEAQAERLISALAEERKLYQHEAAQSGATLNGWGTTLGMLFYTQDSGSVDQQVAEATQYSQRMRTRAAGVLTPAQLAAYVQMQDELLAQFSGYLRPPARKGSSVAARST